MNRFTNRHAVITGGTSGIGLATARRIAEEGGVVLVTGQDPDRLAAADALYVAAIYCLNSTNQRGRLGEKFLQVNISEFINIEVPLSSLNETRDIPFLSSAHESSRPK